MYKSRSAYRSYKGSGKLLKREFEGFKPVLIDALLAILIELVIEMFSRHSPVKGFVFAFTSPHIFLFDALIIFFTLSIGLFFKRRIFITAFLSVIWVLLGVTNCIILFDRTLPFAEADILLIPETITIMPVYFSIWEIAGIAALVIAFITGTVIAFRRMKKTQPNYFAAALGFFSSGIIILVLMLTAFRNVNISPDLVEGYEKYGFPYSFSLSTFNYGVKRPSGYSARGMGRIEERLDFENDDAPAGCAADSPNVIILQLESFIDAGNVKGWEFSENPVPVFSKLRDECESGLLEVPTADGGTISTEFEVLTGLSLDYFAPGEYPYYTCLADGTLESAAYNLRERGYTATVVHNFERHFYSREDVFENLGFENFVSVELMENVEYNAVGWAKDKVLLGEIEKALNASDSRDFIYGISVQEHGKYPVEPLDYEHHIDVSGIDDPEQYERVEYYVNQLYETDMFLGELIEFLQDYDEPVVLAVFGDHIPDLMLTGEDFKKGNEFTTEYVIWTNFGAEPEPDSDLSAYQLTATVLERIGYANGAVTKVHQRARGDSDYQHVLQFVEYDITFGNRYIYGGKMKYSPTDLSIPEMEE